MSKGFRKKTEGGAWQTMWAIHQQLNKDDGNNKYSLKKRGKDFFKETVSSKKYLTLTLCYFLISWF